MKDRRLREKGPSSGSLVRRVFLICLLLLVIPLLTHSYFLYKDDYDLKKGDIQLLIQVVGEGQKALLEERLLLIWDALGDVIENALDRAHRFEMAQIPLPKGKTGQFAYIDTRSKSLIIGKELPSNRALVVATPVQKILYQLTHFEKAPYPIFLSLYQNGKLVAGEEKGGDALKDDFSIDKADFSLRLTSPLEKIQTLHQLNALYRFILLMLIVVFIGGFFVYLLTKRVAKPFQALRKVMQRVSEGASHVRYIPDKMGFEINDLGIDFNETLDALAYHQSLAEKERIHRERLAQELKIGREIQQSLLPTHLLSAEGIDIAYTFLPAKEVSGDFYDILERGDGKIFFSIADTAGKGISACLYSLGLRSSLRTLAETHIDLSEIILRANDFLWLDVKNTGMFITLWIGLYDPKSKILSYACQGHAPAILRRGEKIEELATQGIALGAQKLEAVSIGEKKLEPGDLLFLYTDGLIEAHNQESDLFGAKRMRSVLLKNRDCSSIELVEKMLDEVHRFAEKTPQHDDLTLLSLKFVHSIEK